MTVTQKSPEELAKTLYSTVERTRKARLHLHARLGREALLSVWLQAAASGAGIALAALGIVRSFSTEIAILLILTSAIGLALTFYEIGARPERKRNTIYDACKAMQVVLYDIESLISRGTVKFDEVDKVRERYLSLLGASEENHSSADHQLANSGELGGTKRLWFTLRVNIKTTLFLAGLATYLVILITQLRARANPESAQHSTRAEGQGSSLRDEP